MEMPGVWRAAGRTFRPWRNGGGQTAEVLAWPEGAGFDDFAWRLSTAIVASSGPFSAFPGVDRVLTVLSGGPMVLRVGAEEHRLGPESAPFAFAGDLPAAARLEGGELLDFNVMVRRPLRASVVRAAFDPAAAPTGARWRFLLLLGAAAGLAAFDLVDPAKAAPALVAALAGARVLEVRIAG